MKFYLNFSILLIIFGALAWLSNAGYLEVRRDWPIALIVLGTDVFVVTLISLVKKRNYELRKKSEKPGETEEK